MLSKLTEIEIIDIFGEVVATGDLTLFEWVQQQAGFEHAMESPIVCGIGRSGKAELVSGFSQKYPLRWSYSIALKVYLTILSILTSLIH